MWRRSLVWLVCICFLTTACVGDPQPPDQPVTEEVASAAIQVTESGLRVSPERLTVSSTGDAAILLFDLQPVSECSRFSLLAHVRGKEVVASGRAATLAVYPAKPLDPSEYLFFVRRSAPTLLSNRPRADQTVRPESDRWATWPITDHVDAWMSGGPFSGRTVPDESRLTLTLEIRPPRFEPHSALDPSTVWAFDSTGDPNLAPRLEASGCRQGVGSSV